MRRAGKLLLVVGVLLAVLGGGALFLFLKGMNQASAQVVPPVNVVVAAADIPSFKPLSAEMLQLKSLPPEAVTAENVRDISSVLGKALNTPAKPGQQILNGSLTEQSFSYSVPKGKRAMSIFVDRLSVLNGLLKQGDHVDAIYMGSYPQVNTTAGNDGRYSNPQDKAASGKTVVQNAQVLKIQDPAESTKAGSMIMPENLKLDSSSDSGSGSAGPTQGGLWTVMVAVSDQDAEVLRFAQLNGSVSLVLRASGDEATEETTGVSERILNDGHGVPVPEQPKIGK